MKRLAILLATIAVIAAFFAITPQPAAFANGSDTGVRAALSLDKCSWCNGTGKCSFCGGCGKLDCSACFGTGTVAGKKCQPCNGTGRRSCYGCSGSGTCKFCNGAGEKD